MLSFFFINCIIKYCCLFFLATGCDGLGTTGSLSHFIYMFIHLYVWFCAKNKFFFFFFNISCDAIVDINTNMQCYRLTCDERR